MKRFIVCLFAIFFIISSFAQNTNIERLEPPFWWSGMQNKTVQILVYANNISEYNVDIKSDKVELLKVNNADSPNYLFLDLSINDNSEFEFDIVFSKKRRKKIIYKYKIYQKSTTPQGFSSKDMIYLLMPDRFANGDVSNDALPDMLEKPAYDKPNGRHGGDLQGIIKHIDYFYELGVTTLWLNPVLENNMDKGAYHGYAITDFYTVDKRLGTNELYKNFVEKAHTNGLKVVQDVIYNHCGSFHWWMNDLPFDNWIHTDEDLRSNYRAGAIPDIHSSFSDQHEFSDGWFVDIMPDLNQNNKFLSKYFIQNTIWWIEYLGLDGLRIDTYAYSDTAFTTELNKTLHKEYPNLTLLGETWLQNTPLIAYFQGDSHISGDYNSNLNCVTDFQMYYSTSNAFKEQGGWTTGLARLYYTFSQDFLYSRPEDLVIFLDNHDLDRFFSTVDEDIKKYKMGLAFLMTSRGIPSMYYGTEIAMSGQKWKDDGFLRKNFPGGWDNDSVNVFTQSNMSAQQMDIFNYVKNLANWRKNCNAVTQGKLLQFIPQDNVYVFFRYTNDEAVMTILNNHDKDDKIIDCSRFNEILKDYKSGKEIISGQNISDLKKIKINSKSAMIIELKK